MAGTYQIAFAVVLLVYLGTSYWARLDPRWPIVGAIGLVGAAALATAVGDAALATTLAPYALLLIAGGVVLLLIAPGAEPSAGPPAGGPSAQSSEGSNEGDRTPQDPLDHLQQHPVPVIDRAGDHDDEHEEPGDGEPQQR